jgi:sugar lactone lactonase YvrE
MLLGIGVVSAGVLIACGASQQTRSLFLADARNSRVLVYSAPFATGQSAIAVLGQTSFTVSTGTPVSAASMVEPAGVAVDGAGNLYVSDAANCRVLQFNPPFTTGMAATLAIGQASGTTNLTTGTCLPMAEATSTGLEMPAGLVIDSAGNLWVVDSQNARVLKYPAPITAGEAATVALGQTTTGASLGCNQGQGAVASASTLCNPVGLAFDSAGNLWVSDATNSRVLMYPPANLVTGGSATAELGQPAATAFTSTSHGITGPSATTLFRPAGLAFDAMGDLWVADAYNNRALMYAKTDLATNGAAATVELGQPAATAFTSYAPNNGGIGPSTLVMPYGLAFDTSGRIFVSDAEAEGNNRTLVFTPPFTNGMNATLVLGQADFVTPTPNTGGESAATQNQPGGVATF